MLKVIAVNYKLLFIPKQFYTSVLLAIINVRFCTRFPFICYTRTDVATGWYSTGICARIRITENQIEQFSSWMPFRVQWFLSDSNTQHPLSTWWCPLPSRNHLPIILFIKDCRIGKDFIFGIALVALGQSVVEII